MPYVINTDSITTVRHPIFNPRFILFIHFLDDAKVLKNIHRPIVIENFFPFTFYLYLGYIRINHTTQIASFLAFNVSCYQEGER